MEPRVYTQCGIRFRSELPLPLPDAEPGGWDVDVRWGEDLEEASDVPAGELIAAYESGGERWYTGTESESGFRLHVRDCGEFVVSPELDRIEVRRVPGGRVDLLPVLLAGTVTAFVLTLRGHLVLHASAVAFDGTALAFVGQSGRGKSTVAALLCVEGAALVTDDVLVVDPGPPVTCVGGAAELRLREAAASIARSRTDASTRTTADDRLAFAPAPAPPEPLPLAAIVVPSPSRTHERLELRRLEPIDALPALLSFPRVHGWRKPEVLQREFTALAQLSARLPVHEATIPWGPPFAPGLAEQFRSRLMAEDRRNA